MVVGDSGIRAKSNLVEMRIIETEIVAAQRLICDFNSKFFSNIEKRRICFWRVIIFFQRLALSVLITKDRKRRKPYNYSLLKEVVTTRFRGANVTNVTIVTRF